MHGGGVVLDWGLRRARRLRGTPAAKNVYGLMDHPLEYASGIFDPRECALAQII